jgi:uncharacterized protein (TIGR00369 family)
VGAEPGRVVFALPASPWLRNEWGTVYGGMLTLLAKSAAAAAVQSTARRGTSFTALDVKINFLRAVPADGGERLATGTVLHRGQAAGDRHSRGDSRRCPGGGPDRDDRAHAVPEPGLRRQAFSSAALVGSHGVIGDLQRKAAPDQEAPGPVALTVAARARGEALLE